MVSILQGIGMGIIKISLATALISLTLTQTAIRPLLCPDRICPSITASAECSSVRSPQ